MICAECGCDQDPGANYCRRCGQQISMISAAAGAAQQQVRAYQPASPAYGMAMMDAEKRARVRQNAQPLGITWIVYGVYRMTTGLIAALVVHHFAYSSIFNDASPFLSHLLATIVPTIALVTVVTGLAGLLVGYGLITRQPWGRVLAIVFAILALLKIPFGTALGIYTLWVLTPGAAAGEWQMMTEGDRAV